MGIFSSKQKKTVITCPNGHKLRVPKRKEVLRVTCPKCGAIFRYRFPRVLEIINPTTGVLSVASHYSDRPENKLITVSRIQTSRCPYCYFKEYIERPKDHRGFVTIEAGMGSFFHSYVEDHLRAKLVNNSTISAADTLDVNDLINNFRLSFLWEGRLREPYRIVRSTDCVEDFVRRLRETAENYNRFLANKLVDHQVKGVEGKLGIETESFCIRGKYDLITESPAGLLVLWDWKTGSIPRPEYYREFRNQKIQLGIYAIWMRHTYQTSHVRGKAVFLRDGYRELSETFTGAVEREVLTYTRTWRMRMNAQTSYPPLRNNLCDWCGWKETCPANS